MLGTVIMKELASLLEEIVRAYTQRRSLPSTSRESQQYGVTDSLPHRNDQNKDACYNIFIGDYTINSEVEWTAVTRALLAILSKRMLDLLDRAKVVARLGGHDTQVHILWGAEQRARKVISSMRDGTWPGCGV